MDNISRSESLWRPFKYHYLMRLDKLVEEGDAYSFGEWLSDFRDKFGQRLGEKLHQELTNFILEVSLSQGMIPDILSKKWKKVLRHKLAEA